MAILGDNSQGAAQSPGSGDRCVVTRFTATDTGSNGTAYAYFDASSGSGASAKVVVYTNSSGAPGTLVCASSGVAVPSGGGLVNFGSVTASWTASTDYFVGVVYSDFQPNVSVDSGLSGIDTEMANGTLSYASPPATWPGTDITYSDIRVNAWIDYSAGGATEQIPSKTLRLTSFAPNTYRSIPEPIPSKTLQLTSFAPNATVVIPPIVKQVPSSTLRLNGVAPATYMNVVKQIPSATLRLTSFAPADIVTTPGAIIKQIPAATLRLTAVAPLDYRNIVEPVPSANLTITSFAPNAYVVSPGTEQIPPAYLRLVSFAPAFVNTGREEPARRAAGGGRVHRPQKLVIIGKKRYRIDSYDQLVKLLRDYIREQQQELEEVQVDTKKKKKIKVLQKKIEKAEVRLAKANEEWQQAIQQENEDLILMLVA